jgi:site-specific DNA recombinase
MNALFLKDLAAETNRGLRGRWRRAKCAAGYEVVKRTDSEGEPVRGERKINEAEGRDCPPYLQGVRGGEIACAIATDLNRDGIPGHRAHHVCRD